MIDKPGDIRKEDEINTQILHEYLDKHIPNLQGELSILQYKGGASNLTYLLQFESQAYILRCPPRGTKAKGAHDMKREYNIMNALKPNYPYVPHMIHFCDDESVIGREFYLMEKLTGIIPRANLPKDVQLSPSQCKNLCTSVFDKLVELHKLDVHSTGLTQFGKGEGYIQRQITGWVGRYQKAKTWNVPKCTKTIKWLESNMPTHERICFIHNDFRLDNVVLNPLEPTEVLGILDWEMATLGDPLMDLGNSLAYWVQADDDWAMKSIRRQPTHLPGMMTRGEIIQYYCEKMGFDKGEFKFYEVYGLFRLAVIVQQIYYRYHHKQTTNPAFKKLWLMVHYLNWRCGRVIGR